KSSQFIEELVKDDRSIINDKKSITREFSIKADKELFYYINYSFPLLNEQGDVYGVGSITNERTHAKKLELALQQSNSRFLNIFKNSPVGMVISSHDDRKYVTANKMFVDMFELGDEFEIIGKDPVAAGLVSLRESIRVAQLLKEKNELILEEVSCVTKTGREIT